MAATKKDFFDLMKTELREELREDLRKIVQEILVSEYHHKTLEVNEAAKYIGVSPDTLRTMVREGQIPYYRARGRILFRLQSLDKWMEEQERENYKSA